MTTHVKRTQHPGFSDGALEGDVVLYEGGIKRLDEDNIRSQATNIR
jgi:hypothetical protein